MRKLLTMMLALAMALSLVACGGGENPKKQEAVTEFNAASASFNEMSAIINENASAVDGDLITACQSIANTLNEYQTLLSDDTEVDDATYDETIAWFKEVQAWSAATKAELEAALAAGAAGEAAGGETFVSLVGGWTLSGGLTDGKEWEQADLDATLEMYGGMLQFVFHEDNTVDMVQGGGILNGTYEAINENGMGLIFNNGGEELRYICQLTEADGTIVMLITIDQENYMYFTYMDEK